MADFWLFLISEIWTANEFRTDTKLTKQLADPKLSFVLRVLQRYQIMFHILQQAKQKKHVSHFI